MVEIDRVWIKRSVREQLELLALPGEEALARLRDHCVKADELALDYNHFYETYRENGDEQCPATWDALRRIDELFDQMSGPQNAERWTNAAVISHPDWERVRCMAVEALMKFE